MSTPRGGGADRVPGSEIEGPKRVCKFAGFCRFQPVAIGPICKHTTSGFNEIARRPVTAQYRLSVYLFDLVGDVFAKGAGGIRLKPAEPGEFANTFRRPLGAALSAAAITIATVTAAAAVAAMTIATTTAEPTP